MDANLELALLHRQPRGSPVPLTANSMLKSVQPQTPNGTALNASAMLGLPGLGNNLQDDMDQQLEERRKKGLADATGMDPMQYGAASQIFGETK